MARSIFYCEIFFFSFLFNTLNKSQAVILCENMRQRERIKYIEREHMRERESERERERVRERDK